MSSELTKHKSQATTVYMPQSLDEWMKLSTMIANSELCPKAYKGKPESVFIAAQMGTEIGLNYMQAIQGIAVINGLPCLWGDAALAVVRTHKDFVEIDEKVTDDGSTCIIKRKNQPDTVRSFNIEDAKKAKLTLNPHPDSPWTKYPKRMMQMRARSFAMRDSFPDALRGINIADEVQDYKPMEINITPSERSIDTIFLHLMQEIVSAKTSEQLLMLVPALRSYAGASENMNELRSCYKIKMTEIENEFFDDSSNVSTPENTEEQECLSTNTNQSS